MAASKVSDVDWICVANCCLVSLFEQIQTHPSIVYRTSFASEKDEKICSTKMHDKQNVDQY